MPGEERTEERWWAFASVHRVKEDGELGPALYTRECKYVLRDPAKGVFVDAVKFIAKQDKKVR